MTIDLSTASSAEINAAVAEAVAGLEVLMTPHNDCGYWANPLHSRTPRFWYSGADYLHDTTTVLALLEKTFCTFWWVAKDRAFTGRKLHENDAGYDDYHTFGSIPLEDGAFCRAAIIALLRANGIIVTE